MAGITAGTGKQAASGQNGGAYLTISDVSTAEDKVNFGIEGGWYTVYAPWYCTYSGEMGGVEGGSEHYIAGDTSSVSGTSNGGTYRDNGHGDYFSRSTESDRTVQLYFWISGDNGSVYARSDTYTIPKRAASVTAPTQNYLVLYNSKDGSGAPGTDEKVSGTNLTLSTTTPTKPGFTFNGGNTKTDGNGTNYSAGGTYSSNNNVCLFAKGTKSAPTATTGGEYTTKNILQTFYNNIKSKFKPTNLADYVTEVGGSGYGIGRKGNSGKKECGASIPKAFAVSNSGGNVNYAGESDYENFPSGLFSSAIDFCDISFHITGSNTGINGALCVSPGSGLSTTRTQLYSLISPAGYAGTIAGYLMIHAVGR